MLLVHDAVYVLDSIAHLASDRYDSSQNLVICCSAIRSEFSDKHPRLDSIPRARPRY
jgi:hypothetical protein